ncbi:MAG TPA: hypothetical protein VNT79_05800 [Phycisphaerae bacterium]|nr:hypothetical protein [Phycisphaerae bacterium]
MTQFWAIARNTFLQSIRQPVYGIIVLITLGGIAMTPSITGWTLDDDNKMLRDIGLSTLLIQGLFLACFVAPGILDAEIEDRTMLTVVAKPIRRSVFILGKYAGLFGALLTAHYLACIGLLMAVRHGVLQNAAEKSDVSVVILGPGVVLLLMLLAGILNYTLEWRFLPTIVTLAIPAFTLSGIVLLVMNRDFKLASYETVQIIGPLPEDAAQPGALKDIIFFRPDPGNVAGTGNEGALVRSNWKGPISDADRMYLLGLVDHVQWRKNINYLVQESRKVVSFEIVKAAVLIVGAIGILGSVALASATRLSVVPTFLINFLVIMAGLASDQMIKPLAEVGKRWAAYAYHIIPNFQLFWMVDALEENRRIPLDYIASSLGYAAMLSVAFLLLAMALFETREVG